MTGYTWKKRIIILLISLALNVAGRFLAYSLELPAFLNQCGIILASYLMGPVAGIVSAVLSCALSSLFCPGDWYYLIADIAVAVASGLIARKNKFFERFYLIISATAFFAVVKTPVLLAVNLRLNGGKSGLYLADQIIEYLSSISSPLWLRYTMTALYISFADSLAAVFFIFFGMNIFKSFGKRKRAMELKKQLTGAASLGVLAFLSAALLLFPSRSYAGDSISFVEKLYNSENGLTGGCLNDIAMTKDGTIWIATYGGLFRFNGSKFVLIDNLNCVRSVQCLFVDEEDRLWAGTQDSGVTLLNIDMTWRTLDADTGLPTNSVKCISKDSNGLYYFGTTSGIAVAEYDNGEVRLVGVDTKAGNIKDLSPDDNGHMLVMNNLGEISCYMNGVSVAVLNSNSFTPKSICHDNNGSLYIGCDSGEIHIFEPYTNSFQPKGSITAEGMKTIKDLYFEDNGYIYIAADNGIGYLDGDGHLTTIESGQFNNSIDHIFKDYQGNLWFTSSRCGLLCLEQSCFTDVFKLCGEKSIVSNAVMQWNGYLYTGTNDGLKILDLDAGESIKNEITDVFEGTRIRCLDTDSSGNLLVATYDKGLMMITPEGDISEYIDPSETEKMIRVVRTLSDGTVITSSDAGMVFMKDHKVLSKLTLGRDLAGGTVLNILETDDHTLLCGTDGDGIAVIRDSKLVTYISRGEGLSSGVVLRIAKDTRSDGYFVLTGSGLCYMDKDMNIRELGMPYYNNFDIAENESGEVFVLGGAGIYISSYDSLMEEGRMETYVLLDIKAGLPGSITSNAWNCVTDDEHIYICGTGGVYLLDLNNYEMKVEEFKTKITSIKRDGMFEDVTQFGTIFIPRGTEKIEFDLEINNFTSADPYVSYYLSGVDDEKTTVLSSALGSMTYYDIPYGDHDFIIKVLDDKGRVLSSQTYVFSKEKELYETTGFLLYFYSILFTFIAFIVTSIVQGALWSQQKREKGRHELVVSQLEREKTEATARAIRIEEDANRFRSEFVTRMSREVRAPINMIMGMDTMIMRESDDENIMDYARDINSAGKNLLTVIKDITGTTEATAGKEEYDPDALTEKERFHAPEAMILIVDDTETDVSVTKALLKRTLIQTDTAGSGDEAVWLASRNRYDMILIDPQMTGVSGEETMQNIRTKCPVNAETPVIVITSNTADGAREEYMYLGYTNYLKKPLDGKKLEAMIQNYLPDEKIILTD